MNFSPSNRTASVLLTAVSDSITELEESFTLSLEITDQMTQEFGVELGDRSTASVTVLDTTEGECNCRCTYVDIVHTPNFKSYQHCKNLTLSYWLATDKFCINP